MNQQSPEKTQALSTGRKTDRWLGRNAVLSTILVAGFAMMTVIGGSGASVRTSMATISSKSFASHQDRFTRIRHERMPNLLQPVSIRN